MGLSFKVTMLCLWRLPLGGSRTGAMLRHGWGFLRVAVAEVSGAVAALVCGRRRSAPKVCVTSRWRYHGVRCRDRRLLNLSAIVDLVIGMQRCVPLRQVKPVDAKRSIGKKWNYVIELRLSDIRRRVLGGRSVACFGAIVFGGWFESR